MLQLCAWTTPGTCTPKREAAPREGGGYVEAARCRSVVVSLRGFVHVGVRK